jgi:hypothetical protein
MPRVRARALVSARLGAVLALAAAGCSDDPARDEAGGGAGAAAPMAWLDEAMACGAETFEPCDVLEPGCQQALANIAACQWGGEGTAPVLPPIGTFTRADFLAQLAAASASGPQLPAPVLQAVGATLEWLGLAQPVELTSEAANERLASTFLAFYDFQSKQATLIEDARTGDPRVDDELLFHELVHAQQDARYDLASLASSFVSTDETIAFRSLVEGEAQFHQTLFDLALFDVPVELGTVDRVLEFLRTEQEESWLAQPASAWARSLVLAGYVYGEFMIRDWWLAGGPERMITHFAEPPRESLRMLEAAFGREPTSSRIWAFPANNIFAVAGQALPMPGAEQYPLGTDRLGAWTIYMLARLAGETALARELALGWRGDQLDVFQLAAGGFAGRLRVSFDSEAHAGAFAALLSAKPNVDVRSSGTFVAAALSELPDNPDWLFGPSQAP